MIHTLSNRASRLQIQEMLESYPSMIKLAVDVRQKVLAGGGEMHADCEQVLLDHGSEQDDVWGANWYPDEQRVEYEALINIRPNQGNRSMVIQSEELRQKVRMVVYSILGD